MSSNATTVIVLTGMFLGLPVALLVARDWLTRPSKRKLEEYSRQFTERLRHPDLSAVEKHFGRPLPLCIRALYANSDELLRSDFEVANAVDAAPEAHWYIAFYQPADEQSVRDSWPGLEKYFAFADDGCGNGYLIDPKEEDPPVLFHDHETGEIARVCDHFTEFMNWSRLETS